MNRLHGALKVIVLVLLALVAVGAATAAVRDPVKKRAHPAIVCSIDLREKKNALVDALISLYLDQETLSVLQNPNL